MKVADGMSEQVLMIGPAHTLREAARMMAARNVGAAVVVNPEHSGVGILTERDILNSVAAGESPDTETAGQHCTQDLVFASREWTLEDAAAAMVRGGFRHLVVVEGHEVIGLLSMRDIVRVWSAVRVPAQAVAGREAVASDEAVAGTTLLYSPHGERTYYLQLLLSKFSSGPHETDEKFKYGAMVTVPRSERQAASSRSSRPAGARTVSPAVRAPAAPGLD
jgi:CBS domain-containing protein